jgi:ribonuclease HI
MFTDASHCPHTKAAGWGAWAKRSEWDAGRVAGGRIDRIVESSTEAELCGIANALHHFAYVGALDGITSVMIQCDSTMALGAICKAIPDARQSPGKGRRDVKVIQPRTPHAAIEREALEHIRRLTLTRRVILRHVKAHQEGQGRSWVNGKCDGMARRYMAEIRAERRYAHRASTFFEVLA